MAKALCSSRRGGRRWDAGPVVGRRHRSVGRGGMVVVAWIASVRVVGGRRDQAVGGVRPGRTGARCAVATMTAANCSGDR